MYSVATFLEVEQPKLWSLWQLFRCQKNKGKAMFYTLLRKVRFYIL